MSGTAFVRSGARSRVSVGGGGVGKKERGCVLGLFVIHFEDGQWPDSLDRCWIPLQGVKPKHSQKVDEKGETRAAQRLSVVHHPLFRERVGGVVFLGNRGFGRETGEPQEHVKDP